MEVFSVLATMNLVDMMSSPLNKINRTIGTSKDQLKDLNKSVDSVLTNAMFPLAIAAGAVVTALGSCVGSAIEFESSMADVAKVVDFTSEKELKGMEQAILDMSTKIPMAADGIAAIIANAAQSGVAKENLTEFAEQAAKMGVAFDLTGDQAGKMMADWRAGMDLSLERTYALADSVNHLSNNMNATAPALGEVLQRAGALGMVAGLTEQEVAALGASFLSAGASPEIAATALKKFNITLTKSTAMSKTQAAAFKSLGFEATDLARRMQQDAKGTITEVLTAVSKLPKEIHSSMLTQMFGEESIGAIAPLLKNMDTLTNAFDLVSDKTKYAGSMQAEYETRSKTVANAIQLLQNKFKKLSIVIGNYLLPAVSFMVSLLSGITGVITKIIETPVGEVFIQVAGAISLAALALSGYLLAMKYGSFVMTFFTKGLTAVKAAFLGLNLPIQALIILVGALYIAYKTNLGGIADKITVFYNKAKIVFQGVTALLNNFKDGSASISGSLAKQLKDVGLENTVAALFKIFRRLKAFVTGVFDGISATLAVFREVFVVVFSAISYPIKELIKLLGFLGITIADTGNLLNTDIIKTVGSVIGFLGSLVLGIKAVTLAQNAWYFVSLRFGALLRVILCHAIDVLSIAFRGLHKVVILATHAFKFLGTSLWWTLKVFAKYFIIKPLTIAFNILTVAVKGLGIALKFLALNPIGLALTALITIIGLVIYNCDTLKTTFLNVFSSIWELIKSFGSAFYEYYVFLFNSIKTIFTGIWDFIVNLFSGKSLYDSGAALIDTFKQGILSAWEGLKSSFTDVLQSLQNMLPFSDAKEGPLSALTLSGNRLITTLGEGVSQAAPGFIKDVNGIFSQINPSIDTPDIDRMLNSYVNADPVYLTADAQRNSAKAKSSNSQAGQTTYTITIQNINLPNVQNGGDFMKELEKELMAYGV